MERTFSAVDWVVDTRERLALEKVAREVYIQVKEQAGAHIGEHTSYCPSTLVGKQ